MTAAICVVGKSNEGKTTLLERLIPELKRRGYRIAVVKHTDKEVEVDKPGKDSWRLSRAGPDAVVLSTPAKVFIFRRLSQPSVNDIQRLTGLDFDLFIIEGYKEAKLPKIQVLRSASFSNQKPKKNLLAIVSDHPLPESKIPVFSFDNTEGIADFIEQNFLITKNTEVNLYVNNKTVLLSPFLRKFLARALVSMVSSLKGVQGKINDINLSIKLGD